VAQLAVQEADNDMAGADLEFAEHEGTVNPGALDDIGDVGREIGNRGRAARELVERGDQVGGDARWVELEMFDDAVNVGVLGLERVVEGMEGFDVRVATHLGEDGGTFDGLVGDGVEFTEQGGASDFSHGSKWDGWNGGAVGMMQRRSDEKPRAGF